MTNATENPSSPPARTSLILWIPDLTLLWATNAAIKNPKTSILTSEVINTSIPKAAKAIALCPLGIPPSSGVPFLKNVFRTITKIETKINIKIEILPFLPAITCNLFAPSKISSNLS